MAAKGNPGHGDALPPTAASGWRLATLVLCVLMLVVHAWAGLRTAGVADFWRDLYWATSIAHGERFPTAGPPIYGLLELGPWWFYLLALPVVFGGSAAVVSAFVQVLAASKYLLAWRLGLRLRDERFGFACAFALALPGWSMLPLMFPTHTAVVETTLLLLAGATLSVWRWPSTARFALFGLACAACLHAHPTTVPFVIVAGSALMWRDRRARTFGGLLLAAGIVLSSVLPAWLSPDDTASAALKALPSYLGHDVLVEPVRRFPQLLRSLATGGAWWGYLLMTNWSPDGARLALRVTLSLAAFALAGLLPLWWRDRMVFRFAMLAGALLLIQVGFVLLVRPITPMWMVPSCLPPLAAVLACGAYGWLCKRDPVMRRLAAASLIATSVLALAPFSIEFRELHSVRLALATNPFLDVIERSDRYVVVDVPWYPADRLDRLAAVLCEPAVLHGRLAAIMEAAFASPARNACGAWPTFRYGGVAGPTRHMLGLLPRPAATLGIPPDRVVAGMALYERVRAIAPGEGGHASPLLRRQIDPFSGPAPARVVWTFDASGKDAVVLTNRMPNAAPMQVIAVSTDGLVQSANGSDGSSFGYRCEACVGRARVAWRIEVDAVVENLDLVVVSGDRPGAH